MLKNEQTIKRFSESVKLKVLSELSSGKYTKRELSRIYNVGSSTIKDWIHKYKRADLLNKRVNIESMDELSRIHILQKEITQLKAALVKKDIEQLVSDSYLEVAAHQLGYKSLAELKKSSTPSYDICSC